MLEPVNKRLFTYALLLSLAGIAFAGEDSKKPDDALETARRDLQALPTVEGNVLPGERLPDASLPVPTFTPLTTNPAANHTEQNQLNAPSEGWLLDALRQNDQLKAQQNSRDSNLLRPSDGTGSRRPEQTTQNPLKTYLDSWLSPQDKRMLAGDKQGQRSLDQGVTRQNSWPGTKSGIEPLSASGEMRPTRVGPLAPRSNPYLSNSETEQTVLLEPTKPLPQSTSKSLPNPSFIPYKENTYPNFRDNLPSVGSPKAEERLPVPNAPLIDERRYFPQLRRF